MRPMDVAKPEPRFVDCPMYVVRDWGLDGPYDYAGLKQIIRSDAWPAGEVTIAAKDTNGELYQRIVPDTSAFRRSKPTPSRCSWCGGPSSTATCPNCGGPR